MKYNPKVSGTEYETKMIIKINEGFSNLEKICF